MSLHIFVYIYLCYTSNNYLNLGVSINDGTPIAGWFPYSTCRDDLYGLGPIDGEGFSMSSRAGRCPTKTGDR